MLRSVFIVSLCLQIQPSLLAPHHSQANCIQATVNNIFELKWSLVITVLFNLVSTFMTRRDSFC